jgi:hypothetical protein
MTLGLRQTMTILVESANGTYSTPVGSGIACQFFHVGRSPAGLGLERSELGALRNLHYSPEVTLPVGCQLEVDEYGVTHRYNPLAGTDGVIAPFGRVIQKRVDVTRAD